MGVETLIDVFLEAAAIMSDLELEQSGLSPLEQREALQTYSYRVTAAESIASAIRRSPDNPLIVIDNEIDSAQVMCDLPFIFGHADVFSAYLETALLARAVAKDFFDYA